jgi:AraC-like DNA-binding protein
MALAKDLLRGKDITLDEVARRVGYGSASTFSTAFSRHVGKPPAGMRIVIGMTRADQRSFVSPYLALGQLVEIFGK